MSDIEIENLKFMAEKLKSLNTKIKLLALLDKAKSEFEQSRLVDCKETCKKILDKEPENHIALRALGCVYQADNDFDKALEYYFKALNNSQNKEIETTLIGMIYYLREDFENAIKYFNLAIDYNDNYEPAYDGKNQSVLENHLKILDLQDSLIRQKIF